MMSPRPAPTSSCSDFAMPAFAVFGARVSSTNCAHAVLAANRMEVIAIARSFVVVIFPTFKPILSDSFSYRFVIRSVTSNLSRG